MTSGLAAVRGRTVSIDVTASATPQDGFDDFRREWEAQVGEPWPLNRLDVTASSDFKVRFQAVAAVDVVIADAYSASYVGRTVPDHETGRWVAVHRLRHGSWRFGRLDGRGEDLTFEAGTLIVRHDVPEFFEIPYGSAADLLFLPARAVAPLPGGKPIVGSADTAEVRVLMAHAQMIRETVCDLTPTGLWAARGALVELVRGAMRRELDAVEPLLAPALLRAAMEIADQHLTDPELTPTMLARKLNVSVRTLHRAFAAATAGEPVAAYIRRRRLEQARMELAAPRHRPGVSEVAARYQFADGSHFIRAFKAQYGQTPAEFARASSPLDRWLHPLR
ncbi:helix-turn-helix transcriptional regulator [Streptomyces sp. NPDC056697]|uniref:helix-turn-helix transcriptional regulator n=1 Tax=Streptomyces sp. NPDC056697 TaxID=3345915 RepID=UPI0036BD8DC3